MLISISTHLLLQTALFHSFLCRARIRTQNAWLPVFMCRATYMVWILFSSLLRPNFYIQLYSEKESLIFGKRNLGNNKQVEEGVKRTFILTLISQKRKPKPMRYLDSPHSPLIFLSSGGVGLRSLLLCRNTQGLFLFPGGSAGKESTCNVGDLSSIPVLGRSPGDWNNNSLQYSVLESSVIYITKEVAKSWTWLSNCDCVDHNKLWKILKEMGIPDNLTCLLRNLYAGQEATVRTGHGTDWFQIRKGVLQSCILSPCLSNSYADYIMWNARVNEA